MEKNEFKPGHDAPKRGTYTETGSRGGKYGDVKMKKGGDTMPPTDKPNRHYVKKR